MRVTLIYQEIVGGYVVSGMQGLWDVFARPGAFLIGILKPVNSCSDPHSVVVEEENLPAAIAILRFNGIEVEVEE